MTRGWLDKIKEAYKLAKETEAYLRSDPGAGNGFNLNLEVAETTKDGLLTGLQLGQLRVGLTKKS